MRRIHNGMNVFDSALRRLEEVYAEGHTVVVSVSGGKDSGTCLELAIMAAKKTGRLPVYACTQDEEVFYPGTAEYMERMAAREEVDFKWFVCHQPMVNIFDRASPYFWCFDELVDPDDWVRKYPDWATMNPEINIESIVHPDWFPVAEGKMLFDVIGLRVAESAKRMLGLVSSGGHLTKPTKRGGASFRKIRPIYDWVDGDIWLAHQKFGWDYNRAYDVMSRMGVPKQELRIGPPTMTAASAEKLKVASRAWPRWFDRVCKRLKGVRQVGQFGALVAQPHRRTGETWEDCFRRTCIDEAPADWIRDRSITLMHYMVEKHSGHSRLPFPEIRPCPQCGGAKQCSWKHLAHMCFNGDPFSLKLKPISAHHFPFMEPEFFRDGAGTWNGTPTW